MFDDKLPFLSVQNVAFIYFDVNVWYEFIQDKIGFYAGKREAKAQKSSLLTTAAKIDN